MKFVIFFVFALQVSLFAESKYPANITFMVADLKYSKEHGVKICEIQQGIISKYMGDVFLNPPRGKFTENFDQIFAEFPQRKWTISSQFASIPLAETLKESALWTSHVHQANFLSDPEFLALAKQPPLDPSKIASYSGMILACRNVTKDYDEFCQKYPGILVIDAPSHDYWFDKYKMTTLFTDDEKLIKIKPEWGLYSKKYTETLAEQIKSEIPSDIYVLKPRGAFLGKGVIIVSRDDLDATLKFILTPSASLGRNPDPSYSYWSQDRSDSFMVEKYYQSDLLEYENQLYDPTMRAGFIFIFNENKIEVRFLGGYWILPELAVDEVGTLNQCRKSFGGPPLYKYASTQELEAISSQCIQALSIMYEKMLNQK